MTHRAPVERVVLIDEEFVAERGSVEVTWYVARGEGWVRASGAPGASTVRLDAGPGVVWRSRVELELPRGAPVIRVETRPSFRQKSTFEHLTSRRATRRVSRRRYRVLAGGRLELDETK